MKKNRNIKIKVGMILAITAIIIFFMVIATDLIELKEINPIIELGKTKEAEGTEGTEEIKLPSTNVKNEKVSEKFNENIVFSNTGKKVPYLTFNGKVEEDNMIQLSDDGKILTFKTPLFTNVGDKVVIYYWITNENGEDAKLGALKCKKTIQGLDDELITAMTDDAKNQEENNLNGEEVEKIKNSLMISSKNELQGTVVTGGATTRYAGTIEIELINIPISAQGIVNYEISCEMNATREKN